MKRRYRFLCLLGFYVISELIHSAIGPSYLVAMVFGIVAVIALYVPKVQKRVLLEPWTSGVVVIIAHALGVLFVSDNVFVARSLTSMITHVAVFGITYLLFQGRLEREQ